MKLPNGEQAELGTKLEDYSLNRFHRQGQHKARVFESVLGITLATVEVLRDAVQQSAATSEDAIHKGDNGYGEVYELRFQLTTSNGCSMKCERWMQSTVERWRKRRWAEQTHGQWRAAMHTRSPNH